MKTVAIASYGMGNLGSVVRAVEECGGRPLLTDRRQDFEEAGAIIPPGVGAFSLGMRRLRERGLDEILSQQVRERGIPCLGICLGMQLLATTGWEGGETAGLGWIEGEVRRLEPDGPRVRIPHVGWNEIHAARDSQLLRDVADGRDFYFVHSYHLVCQRETDVIARTPYCGGFASVVGRESVFGVQFHPEKSQDAGFQVLRNFLTRGERC